jgi:hypothetical protein
MFQPLADLKVSGTFDLVPLDDQFALELVKPARNTLRRIVVVRVEKAREHSRGRASPPLIVADGPKQHEQQARFAGHPAHAFGLRELRLD